MLNFIRRSKKGMTVIEVLVSMAVFGIISVPLMGIFLDSMVATKLAQDKIETNALVSIVKDTVTKNVKCVPGGTIRKVSSSDLDPVIILNDVSGTAVTAEITTGSAHDLKIEDKKGKDLGYKFDADRICDFGQVSCGGISSTTKYPDTCEYQITIRNIHNNMAIQKFRFYVNRVN